MLENGDLKAPLNLQNRTCISDIQDEDENCLEVQVPEALRERIRFEIQ